MCKRLVTENHVTFLREMKNLNKQRFMNVRYISHIHKLEDSTLLRCQLYLN